MWGAEEMGESGARYGRDHADEVPRMVAASESDAGAGAIFALALPPGGRLKPELAELQSALAPLRINIIAAGATTSGADTSALHQAGVPAFSFDQDASKYFDLHHSQNDTLEQIDKDDLAQNVAAWSVVLYYLANTAVDLRAPARPPGP
jgi:Zn-dependent M28 family amino/carboxypeptidase